MGCAGQLQFSVPRPEHVSVIGNQFSRRRGTIVSGAVGGTSGRLRVDAVCVITRYRRPVDRRCPARHHGIAAGWLIVRRLDVGVEQRLLTSYQNWVMPGESLVLVSVSSDRAASGPRSGAARGVRAAGCLCHSSTKCWSEANAYHVLRRERFTTEQIKRHAAELATRQRTTRRSGHAHPMWDRVRTTDRTIDAISADLAEAAQREQSVSLGRRVAARQRLPHPATHRRRPTQSLQNTSTTRSLCLDSDSHVGEPRVYVLASEFVGDTDAEVYEQDIVDFLLAYQENVSADDC